MESGASGVSKGRSVCLDLSRLALYEGLEVMEALRYRRQLKTGHEVGLWSCKWDPARFLTGAGQNLEEVSWLRKTLLCSEGGRDICGEEGGLSEPCGEKSLGVCSQSWGAMEHPKILCCWSVVHTAEFSVSASCEVWRVLRGEQWVNGKLERKCR